MDKIYRKIFCGTLLGYVQLRLCPGRSSSLCQVHPIHNLKLLPASTCVYYMCQHVCILHVLAHVFTTRASTCIYYTCQHVCIVHVLARVFITCARLLFKNMRPGCHTVCRKMVKRQKILSREFISFGLEPDFIFLVKGSA